MDELDPKLPGDQEGLDEDAVEALLSSLGGGDAAPPADAGDDEAAAGADDRIIKQEDVDALLAGGLKAGDDALGTSKEFIEVAAGDVFTGKRGPAKGSANIDLLIDVPLKVKIELGRNKMSLEDILRLKEGSIVELDKLAGDPLDVLVNDRLVAKGEVLVLNDNFCIRITEIVNPDERQKKG
ncbi:MAG: flagellar motor switch protein FliN [Planctomycetota bacterium]|nr:MAG: flagellar motor switch protein FliN [Planctomycetota bacterium]